MFRGLLTVTVLSSFAIGCSQEPEGAAPAPAEDRCEAIIETMAQCMPDLATQARCSAETIAQFDRLDEADKDCDSVDALGKADFFGLGSCGAGQHTCGYIFCCADYELTWYPSDESDWDVVEVVRSFQAAAPSEARGAIDGASKDSLRRIKSVSFLQSVAESLHETPRDMAVHITRGLVDTPYAEFVEKLPPETWGVELDHYLGGEVKVYEWDSQGRVTRQLERMVLSPMPFDLEAPISNNDMTKVEVIHYTETSATIYWRVMHSDNDSTEADVGSVDFRAYDEDSTIVTFHSAHRLNMPGGLHIPNSLVTIALEFTFQDFVAHYFELVW